MLRSAIAALAVAALAACGKQPEPSVDAGRSGPTSSPSGAPDGSTAGARAVNVRSKCTDPRDPTWSGGALQVFVHIPTTTVWKPEKPGDKIRSDRRIFSIFCASLSVGTSCSVTELDADALATGEIREYQLFHRRDFTILEASETVYTLFQAQDHATLTVDYDAQVVKYAVDEPRKQGRPAPVVRGEGPCPKRAASAE